MAKPETKTAAVPHFDAVIVGAGWAGIYMLYRLRALGLRVRLFEAGDGVGGTWYWNRYPGARCDTPSLQYSFSFADELQQEWEWTELYASQPEIERYANHVVDRFDLRRDMQFGSRVTSARYDEGESRWTIEASSGDVVSAQFCIMATGGYSVPVEPSIPGLADYEGELCHTAKWTQDAINYAGKRVGVIGTGSSGMQAATAIAKEPVAHLYVFQRTANFVVPSRNAPMDPEYQKDYKATYPERRERARHTGGGLDVIPLEPAKGPTMSLSVDEFRHRADEAWRIGGISAMTAAFQDSMIDEAANERLADYIRAKVREVVQDPSVAELLSPRGHYVGARRILISDEYLSIFNRDDVSLVDVGSAPVERFTASGLTTSERGYELDIVVLATGFDSGSGAMQQVDFKGRDGVSLVEKWADGPITYLGIGIEGFPNLFMVAQAGSPSIRSHVMVSIEQHVEWISTFIDVARQRSVETIEPTPEAEAAWTAHVAEVAGRTLLARNDTQFNGANVAGKPRVYTSYVGGVGTYRNICDRVRANAYEGWSLTTADADVSGSPTWSGPSSVGDERMRGVAAEIL